MKHYIYENKPYTIKELEDHPDCRVTSRELRDNIWKKKMDIEDAMVTPAKRCTHLAKKRYHFHGLDLTVYEIADLQECEVSCWVLQTRLRAGFPVHLAMKSGKIEMPEKESTTPPEVLEEQRRRLFDNIEHVRMHCPAASGSISFNPEFIRKKNCHQYWWIVCQNLGLEMDDQDVDLEKYLDKWLDCH